MTGIERHKHRDAVAYAAGYRPKPTPDSPEWAGYRLPEATDEQAARAALALRGLPVEDGVR